MRLLWLLSLLLTGPAYAQISYFDAVTISCRNHFRKDYNQQARAFCACYPKALLTKENLIAVEEAGGVMNQEVRKLFDAAGEKCLKDAPDDFRLKARDWIEDER